MYRVDAFGIYRNKKETNKVKILMEKEDGAYRFYITESYDLLLGILVGVGFSALIELIKGIVERVQKPRTVNFSYLETETMRSIEYQGDIKGLSLFKDFINTQYPIFLREQEEIINKIDTGWGDSTEYLRNQLKEAIKQIIPLAKENLGHFCQVLQ